MGTYQHPTQWLPEAITFRVKYTGPEADNSSLQPSSRISGAIPPLPNTPLRRAQTILLLILFQSWLWVSSHKTFRPHKVLPYVPTIKQDSTLITHAHFCTLFRTTAVRMSWYRTNIFFIHVNCTEFNFQMFRDDVSYTILRQRPNRKFWLEHQTQNIFMMWLIGCDSCYHL